MVGVGMIYNIYSIISTLSFDSKKKSFHRPILEHARNEPQCAVWHVAMTFAFRVGFAPALKIPQHQNDTHRSSLGINLVEIFGRHVRLYHTSQRRRHPTPAAHLLLPTAQPNRNYFTQIC